MIGRGSRSNAMQRLPPEGGEGEPDLRMEKASFPIRGGAAHK